MLGLSWRHPPMHPPPMHLERQGRVSAHPGPCSWDSSAVTSLPAGTCHVPAAVTQRSLASSLVGTPLSYRLGRRAAEVKPWFPDLSFP